jgi:hypothetical protein
MLDRRRDGEKLSRSPKESAAQRAELGLGGVALEKVGKHGAGHVTPIVARTMTVR